MPIIVAICSKSERLSVFAPQKAEGPSLELTGDLQLLHRSRLRRSLYERSNLDSDEHQAASDLQYHAGARYRVTQGHLNVFESVMLIRKWAAEFSTTRDLAGILQRWPTIGGYDRVFDKVLLSDLLSLRLADEWGSLVNLCRKSDSKDKSQLMFLFGVISFRGDVNMDVVRTMISFAIWDDLKVTTPPHCLSYVQVRHNQVPRVDSFRLLMKTSCIPYAIDERSSLHTILSFKQRKNLEVAEVAYEQKTEDDCEEFAEFLLNQWPCQDPTVEGFPSPTTIDLVQALEIIRPEWDRLFQNLELSRHIEQVQVVLNQHHGEAKIEQPVPSVENQETLPTRGRGGEFPSRSADLLRKSGPVLPKQLTDAPNEGGKFATNKYSNNLLAALPNEATTRNLQDPIKVIHSKPTVATVSCKFQELQNIIKGISTSHSAVRRQCGQDLMQSLNALITLKSVTKQDLPPINPERLSADMSNAQRATKEQFN